jgi:coxsackievirus/adenovirus receptor
MKRVRYGLIGLGFCALVGCGGGGGGTTTPPVDTNEPDDGAVEETSPDVLDVGPTDTDGVTPPDTDKDIIDPPDDGKETTEPDTSDVPVVPDVLDDVPTPDGQVPDGALPCEEQEKCDTKIMFAVCGIDSVTYPNDCYALCAGLGFDDYTPGPCEECPQCDVADQATGEMCDPVGQVTYDNLYEACCAGLTVDQIQPGACITDPGCAQCPADYVPVCAKKADGSKVTYDNICTFEFCNPDKDVFECGGPCGDTSGCTACALSSCSPVCGKDGQTYFNACYANCGQTQVDYAYPCCDCPPPSEETQVCSTAGNTHGSMCELTCKLEEYSYDGVCIPGCQPTPDDPPDGICGNMAGTFKIFFNEACATAAGATCIHDGPCQLDVSPCLDTDTSYSPVCAIIPGEDKMQTYPNTCYAGCDGATGIQSGLCTDPVDSDNCETICALADPKSHCSKEDCVLYPNSCIPVKCMGYKIADLMKNDCDEQICPSP